MQATDLSADALGRLASCRIAGLFGRREDVYFNTAEDGPTLLYGRNGTGKSTVLRIINDVANTAWLSIRERPFERVELTFDGGGRLAVEKSSERLTVVLNEETWSVTSETLRHARRRWVMRRKRAQELGRPYLAQQARLFDDDDLAAPWMAAIPRLFPVTLITDQRLVLRSDHSRPDRSPTEVQSAVSRYPPRLYEQIQRALSAYAAHSQELDRRFPMKIAAAVEQDQRPYAAAEKDVSELRALLARVRAAREELEKVGLLGREEENSYFDARRLEAERVRPVIRAFAEDTLAKFDVLRDVRVRLELFTSFLNQHYQDKTVVVDRENGFVIQLRDGSPLLPSQLSSGEQQVLGLAYQVLFDAEPRTLILIDEPELSLHVLWQSTLIDDFVAMGRVRDVDFIMATHSPTLIGDRAELMRSLDTSPTASTRPGRRRFDDESLFLEFDDDELGDDAELEAYEDSTDKPI